MSSSRSLAIDARLVRWAEWLMRGGYQSAESSIYRMMKGKANHRHIGSSDYNLDEVSIEMAISAIQPKHPKTVEVLRWHYGAYRHVLNMRVKDKTRALSMSLKTYYRHVKKGQELIQEKLSK